jgi:hypothetical protein
LKYGIIKKNIDLEEKKAKAKAKKNVIETNSVL